MNWTELAAGEVGFIVAGIKDIHGAPVGDTIVLANNSEVEALSGFRKFNLKYMQDCFLYHRMILKTSVMLSQS